MSGCSIPHRLALLATSPAATGEAKIEDPRKGAETLSTISTVMQSSSFKNQNLARGRKHFALIPNSSEVEAI